MFTKSFKVTGCDGQTKLEVISLHRFGLFRISSHGVTIPGTSTVWHQSFVARSTMKKGQSICNKHTYCWNVRESYCSTI